MRVLMVTDTPFAGLRHRPQQLAIGLARQGHDVLYLAPTSAYRSAYEPDRFASAAPSQGDALPADRPATDTPPAGMAPADTPPADTPPAGMAPADTPPAGMAPADTPPAGMAPADTPPAGSSEFAPVTPSNGAFAQAVGGVDLPTNLRRRELPESDEVRHAATLKEAWALWGEMARREVVRLVGGPSSEIVQGKGARAGRETFAAEIIYCDHPALVPFIKNAANVPVVIDCSEDFEAQVTSRSAIEAYREALSVALPSADGMIANHRYMIESWDRYLAADAPRTVIEHGVDLDLFHPTVKERAEALRRELEIPAERPMVTFLGHVDARISYEDLLSMMAAVPEPLFVFVGQVRPDGLPLLQRLPAERIRPLGALRPERAAEIVGASDALILPLRREPHLEAVRGLNLYEYLATGRPIAASFRRVLKAYRDCIYLYATQDELEVAIRACLAEAPSENKVQQRLALARQAGWSRRVEELIQFLAAIPKRPINP
jgi:glycosyltransferase involved in cell wall biosynthesis